MAIKFDHEESIYEISQKIVEKSRNYTISNLLLYLMRTSEYGNLKQESAFNTEGWEHLFEDDQVLATEYTYYDEHNERKESQWSIYSIIEDNTILRININDSIGHIYYNTFDNADQYIVKTTIDSEGQQRVTIFDGNGKAFADKGTILIQPEILPETIKLVDAIRPTNLNDMIDKVMSKTK